MADEIAGGDVRDAEEVAEAAGVGALADAGATQEHPLHVPLRRILAQRKVAEVLRRRVGIWFGGEEPTRREGEGGGGALNEAGYGRHWNQSKEGRKEQETRS